MVCRLTVETVNGLGKEGKEEKLGKLQCNINKNLKEKQEYVTQRKALCNSEVNNPAR